MNFRCPQCRITVKRPRFPLRCACGARYTSADQMQPGKTAPSMLRRARNLARDTIKHAANRGRLVDDATKERRLEACRSCLLYFNGQICTHPDCGCGMKSERGLTDAAGWESKECPVGRWDRPAFVRTSQLVTDTLALAGRLPADLAGIVGIPRSGMIPASILSAHLHLPLWTLSADGLARLHSGWRITDNVARQGPLLVIDDNQMTGNSLKAARKLAESACGGPAGGRLLWAVVYRGQKATGPRPEFVQAELRSPLLLEWNLFNSIHSPQLACDLDGILCRDGQPSQPQYTARRVEIPLIVTGRPEQQRAGTLAWLAQHGMTCKKIVMWPAERPWSVAHLEEADGEGVWAVSRFKAQHFAASGLKFFCESDERQAREIAGLTGKPVICPAAGRVF